ncbi:pancreatic triacylglycerol lipase-like isoform X1 [Amphibalanus amphitrite]|uniref:pancreatic triacylglycerol lipase-like isoform X1 n=2 Tax=Amphibalanus amphitrite TaxID=1232801 RepID=UPI001C91CD95|nr:pancreatic triacylglycerol lipase-like isoform X1 [Amphibalanus amphitrite]
MACGGHQWPANASVNSRDTAGSSARWCRRRQSALCVCRAAVDRRASDRGPTNGGPHMRAVLAPMVAAGISSLLLVYGITLFTITLSRGQLFLRAVPRSIQLGDNETTALIKQCYGVYGCFAITNEWISLSRPISVLPQSPKTLNVKFCLFTPENPTECQRMYDHDIESIQSSSFMADAPVKFIVHGYLDSGEKRWIKRMVAALLDHQPMNVLVVDWVGGSGPPYTQAVANIRLVGAIVGRFIQILHKLHGTPSNQMHVIGHSLGAHLAGYVGDFLHKTSMRLGRITGLDPAEPHFENTDPVVRLNPTDADFVDVIHTDSGPLFSGGLGLHQPIGHMDFFPNGGKKQPGCGTSVLDAIKKEEGSLIYGLRRFIGCNHLRAYEFFTESINSDCPFLAIECNSYEQFAAGECGLCSPKLSNCHRLGYHADANLTSVDRARMRLLNRERVDLLGRPLGARTFYLLTGNDVPFCRRHYRVTVFLSDVAAAVRHGGDMGAFKLRFHSASNVTDWHRLGDSDQYFEPGQKYVHVSAVSLTGPPLAIDLEWSHSSFLLNPLTWRLLSRPMIHVNRVVAVHMETRERFVFCGEDLPLTSGRSARLRFNPRCRPQRPAGIGSLYATLANIDIVGGVGSSVMGLVDSDSNVIPTRRRRRRRRRRRGRHRNRDGKLRNKSRPRNRRVWNGL